MTAREDDDIELPPEPAKAARRLGQEPLRPLLPKRFYTGVTVEAASGGFAVLLDGHPVKTPAKDRLCLPRRAFADLVASEWRAQGERIDPATMPVTRLANTTIDAVIPQLAEVRADIVAFAGNDALCYRAGEPERLAAREAESWDPILAWAASALGADLQTCRGIVHTTQPDSALAAVARDLAGRDAWQIAPMHVITSLTGSAILALAIAHRRLDAAGAWAAAHIDEDWQIEQWGADEEARLRRQGRWHDMRAAVLTLETVL
jgi:chaperone required for assembly of F1-ATPase